jgi:N-acetylneuraminic acid mutarotase
MDVESGQYILPKPRAHHGACSIRDDEMFVFGGLSNAGWASVALSDLWLFNYKEKTWRLISSPTINIVDFVSVEHYMINHFKSQDMLQPQPRYGHVMVGSKKHNKLFVIGGCSKKGEPLKEIISFDINSGQW